MKNLELDKYPNLLDRINFTSDDIYNAIKDYKLIFFQKRLYSVEKIMQLPLFIEPFYKYAIKKQKIITQNDFFILYKKINESYFKRLNEETIFGIKARVYRTYPSLVRDIYFNLYVKENLKEAKIIFNPTLDYKEGIDLLVVYKDKFYGINLFTQTNISISSRELKLGRHTSFDNVISLDLPVNLSSAEKCGRFSIYGEKELNQIKELISYDLR